MRTMNLSKLAGHCGACDRRELLGSVVGTVAGLCASGSRLTTPGLAASAQVANPSAASVCPKSVPPAKTL